MEEAQKLLPSVPQNIDTLNNEADPATLLPVKPTLLVKDKLYNLPTSSTTNLIMETLVSGQNITDIPKNKQKISHGTRYEVHLKPNTSARKITMRSPKSYVAIEITDIDKFSTRNSSPAKKLFVFALIKANEHSIFNGQLDKDYVTFPLQELIDIGFYRTIQSARKGFKNGLDILTSLKVEGILREENHTEAKAVEVLFTGGHIKNNECTIFFNRRIDWNFITTYFTILPKYYFKLPNKASDLLYYIFFLARQHTQDIDTKGYFTISFRAIQSRLHLPNEDEVTKNPKRDIQEPIEEAIKQLEDEHGLQYGSNTDFQLMPCYNANANITDFLNNGYLKVILKGIFADAFIQLNKNTAKQIEQSKDRKKKQYKRKLPPKEI